MCTTVIFHELSNVNEAHSLVWGKKLAHTACISPAKICSVVSTARRFPDPIPLKLDRGGAICRIVAYKMNIGVFMQIWVRIKLSSNEILQYSLTWSNHKGQSIYDCLNRYRSVLPSSGIKGELEVEHILICQFQ